MTEIARGDLAEENACFSATNFRLDCKSAFEEDAEVATECAKYDGTILLVREGEHNTQVIERAINILNKQGCNIIGVLLYDADAWIMKFYYYKPVSVFATKNKAVVKKKAEQTEDIDTDTENIFVRGEHL